MTTSVQQIDGQLVVATTDPACGDCLEPLLEKLPGYAYKIKGEPGGQAEDGCPSSQSWSWDELPDLDAIDALERFLVDPPEDCEHKIVPTDLF